MANRLGGIVMAVSRSGTHTMSKPNQESIQLVAGLGVAGDAHQGETVKHRSRVRRDPTRPNLRQVHLIHAELHDEPATLDLPSRPDRWARISPPAASICWDYRSGRVCSWATRRRSR